MANWIELDPTEFNEPEDRSKEGVRVFVSHSLYDVPTHVKGAYDDARKHFVIEFRYLVDDEDSAEEVISDHVRLRVGKASYRIRAIELDVDALGAKSVELKLKALDAIKQYAERFKLRRRYDAPRQVVDTKKDELFASAA